MIDPKDLTQRSDALHTLLKAKLGLRGKTLAVQLKSAGRLLPKRLHKDGQVIVSALSNAHHPKLAVRIDQARLGTAFANFTNHLDEIDPKDRRKGKLLGWLGGQVFNLILIGGGLIALLMWRGLIG